MARTNTTKSRKSDSTPKVDRVAETFARVTEAIISDIESGIANPAEWRPSWTTTPGMFRARNAATGEPYRGGNRFLLGMLIAGGASPWWATYDQWQTLGAQVPKGVSAAAYILRPLTKKIEQEDPNADPAFRIVGYKAHAVWHAGQVTGWTAPAVPGPPALADAELEVADQATRWAARIGIRVEHGQAGAFYSPLLDFVGMPDAETFHSGEAYWATLAHEATHWTRHESRLNRDPGFRRFGDEAYAAEELCAELGAAFVMADLGMRSDPRPDHAQYLAHWLTVLRAAPDALWRVAGKAQRAAEYLGERAEVGGFVVA